MKRLYSKKTIALSIIMTILLVLMYAVIILQLWFDAADRMECWTPDYEMVDITQILNKETLDDDDYQLLYEQTGLTKIGVNRCLNRGATGKTRILNIQKNYFTKHTVVHAYYTYMACTDWVSEFMPNAYLENGDIFVTSSTHISGWRMGHSGLVTNAQTGSVLEATNYDQKSQLGIVTNFTRRINFLLLSPKVDSETKAEVADFANKNLLGIQYSALVGIFSKKDGIEKTQCSHVIWYAYNHFGYDIDSNGGGLVTPHDMAVSPLMEVVQVFGFDPTTLWT